jgi:hypothetical protein
MTPELNTRPVGWTTERAEDTSAMQAEEGQ